MAYVERNIKIKKHKPRFVRNLRAYFLEYCKSTSIHGFQYLGERRNRTEKIFWFIFLTISLYFCVNLIKKTYEKWDRSPVIVSFSTNEMPIWEIPFPAVTICPRTKATKTKFNFTEMALLKNNNTKIDGSNYLKAKKFEYMSLLCSSNLKLYSDKQAKREIDANVINFFIDVQPDFNETLKNYSWVGEEFQEAREFFKPIVTSEGVCYTFNMLDRDDLLSHRVDKRYYVEMKIPHEQRAQWSVERGYDADANLSSFPRRTIVSGSDGGLSLLLYTADNDLDYICGDALQGYNVIIHQPAQLPNPKLGAFRVGLNQDVAISVEPQIMKTSAELKTYDFKKRNCYILDERKLSYFKIYSQENCLVECLANFTRVHCGCVAFYMPRQRTTPICGPAIQKCVEQSYSIYLTSEITFKIEHPEDAPRNASEDDYDINQECNCLPSCESLRFDAEVTQSKWDWYKGTNIVSANNESHKIHLSRLKIYFKDMQFITSQRNELYGTADFMANCGGLLGLFTGFSLLSLVEVFYFATLRFACNFRKYGLREWAGANQLSDSDEDDD